MPQAHHRHRDGREPQENRETKESFVSTIVVLENPARWHLRIPGVMVMSAKDYLLDPTVAGIKNAKVFNLCRHYTYQTAGYYVSLLAAARGHRPLPTLATLQDLRQPPLVRMVSQDLDDLIQRSLSTLKSNHFDLSIYFGRNMAKRYDDLSAALFRQFPCPFLRAEFVKGSRWRLERIRAIATGEIPEPHRPFVSDQATKYFQRPRGQRRSFQPRYDLAILVNEQEPDPPSDSRALRKFQRAARQLGLHVEMINKDDYGRIAEFDALFIRETTLVNHHTYRFASRAAAEGLVVIDDPESILRCTNKVFQAEVFARYKIPCPKTVIVHRNMMEGIAARVGLPCVVKRPDSSFSQGVAKATTEAELTLHLTQFLEKTELAIVQAFTPSEFDWRIGVLNRKPLYACRYFMARGHWTIQISGPSGQRTFGRVEAVPLQQAPRRAVDLAIRASRAMGDGLYGVDIKPVVIDGRRQFVVIEVNDNPSIWAGCEDQLVGDELYETIMREFLRRLEARSAARAQQLNGTSEETKDAQSAELNV
jgi:glutathione synthase/RimK-type ligase-like ATP-grasp enzyme